MTTENSIDFLGLEGARVLSTPHLIGFMERTCRNLVKDYLDEGHDTVGTDVHVQHLAAAPIGAVVAFRAEVLTVVARRINFRVEAWNGAEKVGQGTHERAVINVQRFASRMAAKKG